jgi:hypothetical protein
LAVYYLVFKDQLNSPGTSEQAPEDFYIEQSSTGVGATQILRLFLLLRPNRKRTLLFFAGRSKGRISFIRADTRKPSRISRQEYPGKVINLTSGAPEVNTLCTSPEKKILNPTTDEHQARSRHSKGANCSLL